MWPFMRHSCEGSLFSISAQGKNSKFIAKIWKKLSLLSKIFSLFVKNSQVLCHQTRSLSPEIPFHCKNRSIFSRNFDTCWVSKNFLCSHMWGGSSTGCNVELCWNLPISRIFHLVLMFLRLRLGTSLIFRCYVGYKNFTHGFAFFKVFVKFRISVVAIELGQCSFVYFFVNN